MYQNVTDEITWLRERLEQTPNSMMFARLADRYLQLEEVDRAIEICQSGLDQHDTYATAHLVLAKCLMARKQYDEAEKQLSKALSFDPKYLKAHQLYSELMRNIGYTTSVKTSYERILEVDPLERDIRESLEAVQTEERGSQLGSSESKPIFASPSQFVEVPPGTLEAEPESHAETGPEPHIETGPQPSGETAAGEEEFTFPDEINLSEDAGESAAPSETEPARGVPSAELPADEAESFPGIEPGSEQAEAFQPPESDEAGPEPKAGPEPLSADQEAEAELPPGTDAGLPPDTDFDFPSAPAQEPESPADLSEHEITGQGQEPSSETPHDDMIAASPPEEEEFTSESETSTELESPAESDFLSHEELEADAGEEADVDLDAKQFQKEENQFSDILDEIFSPNIAEEEKRENRLRESLERALKDESKVPETPADLAPEAEAGTGETAAAESEIPDGEAGEPSARAEDEGDRIEEAAADLEQELEAGPGELEEDAAGQKPPDAESADSKQDQPPSPFDDLIKEIEEEGPASDTGAETTESDEIVLEDGPVRWHSSDSSKSEIEADSDIDFGVPSEVKKTAADLSPEDEDENEINFVPRAVDSETETESESTESDAFPGLEEGGEIGGASLEELESSELTFDDDSAGFELEPQEESEDSSDQASAASVPETGEASAPEIEEAGPEKRDISQTEVPPGDLESMDQPAQPAAAEPPADAESGEMHDSAPVFETADSGAEMPESETAESGPGESEAIDKDFLALDDEDALLAGGETTPVDEKELEEEETDFSNFLATLDVDESERDLIAGPGRKKAGDEDQLPNGVGTAEADTGVLSGPEGESGTKTEPAGSEDFKSPDITAFAPEEPEELTEQVPPATGAEKVEFEGFDLEGEEEPAAEEEPVAEEEPAAEEEPPAQEEPVAEEEPAAEEELAAIESSAEEPSAEESSAEEPSAEESSAEEPTEKFVTPTLGEIYAAQGQYAKAISVFEILHKKHPENEWYGQKLESLRQRLKEEGK